MPRCCSSRIQSEVAWRAALRPLTVPAIWMAPPNSSSFSVNVVLPASGCEMIANVRRRAISWDKSVMAQKIRKQLYHGGAKNSKAEPPRLWRRIYHGHVFREFGSIASGKRQFVYAHLILRKIVARSRLRNQIWKWRRP